MSPVVDRLVDDAGLATALSLCSPVEGKMWDSRSDLGRGAKHEEGSALSCLSSFICSSRSCGTPSDAVNCESATWVKHALLHVAETFRYGPRMCVLVEALH